MNDMMFTKYHAFGKPDNIFAYTLQKLREIEQHD